MARIGLVRIDSRLIHGQVCTQWLYRTNSKKVYIVDDEGASNSFLSSIYKMACPVGVELETISTEDTRIYTDHDVFDIRLQANEIRWFSISGEE